MQLKLKPEPTPIDVDADGVAKIGGTRVTLDTVISAFNKGATPETIAQQYPTLHLADIYAVIAYYLRDTDAVEQYLAERQQKALEVQHQNETLHPAQGIRERLLARRQDT